MLVVNVHKASLPFGLCLFSLKMRKQCVSTIFCLDGLNAVCVNIYPFPVSCSLCFPDQVGITTVVIVEIVQGRKLMKH